MLLNHGEGYVLTRNSEHYHHYLNIIGDTWWFLPNNSNPPKTAPSDALLTYLYEMSINVVELLPGRADDDLWANCGVENYLYNTFVPNTQSYTEGAAVQHALNAPEGVSGCNL